MTRYVNVRIIVLMFIALLILSGLQGSITSAQGIDIDVYGRVVYVIDGDTIDVIVLKVFDQRYEVLLNQKIRIRFADINAPELYTYKGKLAKRFLYSLIYGKYVYLNIDDLYTYDKYGRVVAVVYLPVNSTHLRNINLYLVMKDYAEIDDYPNEFNPYTWNLLVNYPEEQQSPYSAITSLTTTVRLSTGIIRSEWSIVLEEVASLNTAGLCSDEQNIYVIYINGRELKAFAIDKAHGRIIKKISYGVESATSIQSSICFDNKIYALALSRDGHAILFQFSKNLIQISQIQLTNWTIIGYAYSLTPRIVTDGTYLYLIGRTVFEHGSYVRDYGWRIEKRDPSTLTVINTYVSNPSKYSEHGCPYDDYVTTASINPVTSELWVIGNEVRADNEGKPRSFWHIEILNPDLSRAKVIKLEFTGLPTDIVFDRYGNAYITGYCFSGEGYVAVFRRNGDLLYWTKSMDTRAMEWVNGLLVGVARYITSEGAVPSINSGTYSYGYLLMILEAQNFHVIDVFNLNGLPVADPIINNNEVFVLIKTNNKIVLAKYGLNVKASELETIEFITTTITHTTTVTESITNTVYRTSTTTSTAIRLYTTTKLRIETVTSTTTKYLLLTTTYTSYTPRMITVRVIDWVATAAISAASLVIGMVLIHLTAKK